MPITNWAALFTPIIAEFDRYIREVVREECLQLSFETAAAAAKAEENEQVLTVQQAAALLGMRPQTVYEWIKAGKLPSFTIGTRSVRLQRGAVLAALQAHSQPNGRRKYVRRVTVANNRKAKEVAYA